MDLVAVQCTYLVLHNIHLPNTGSLRGVGVVMIIQFYLIYCNFVFVQKTIFIRIMYGKVGVFILTLHPPFLDIFKNKVVPCSSAFIIKYQSVIKLSKKSFKYPFWMQMGLEIGF